MQKILTQAILIAAILIVLPSILWAGGASEESADRGQYLAGQGKIIPAEEIKIDSYISQIDYRYPDPEGDLAVNLYTGHRQVSTDGQEQIVQIGIQGRRARFEDLPPMNLAFVFDRSGSMSAPHKIQWVKEAFEIFIRRLRDCDTVSVVAFAEAAEVLLPATRLDRVSSRKELIEKIRAIKPEGESDLKSGLLEAYRQVETHFDSGFVNRIIFVSDGLGSPGDMLATAGRYKERGINVSTVGVGSEFNSDLMHDLATKSGGSSRFMSNRTKIREVFGTDLDRMVVPVARELEMEIEFLQDVKIHQTWGYDHSVVGSRISYYLATLHHRDYETILIWVTIPPGAIPGKREFARFSLSYRDMSGRPHSSGPHTIELKYADLTSSRSGFSNSMVLKAGTMLHVAQGLKNIGTLYHSCEADNRRRNSISGSAWRNRGVEKNTLYDEVVQREIEELQKTIQAKKQRCLDLSVSLKREIHNAHMRLQEEIFKDELAIFEMYIKKLGRELSVPEAVVSRLLEETEIAPDTVTASVRNRISDLVEELMLDLETKSGPIAFSGFAQREGESSPLGRLIDDMTRQALARIPSLSVIPYGSLESHLREKDLTRLDLTDTSVALKTAERLKVDYILTGSIIEMPSSVVLFARILNRKTEAVDSVAQLILPLNDEVRALLHRLHR